jgi:hypothetical protein
MPAIKRHEMWEQAMPAIENHPKKIAGMACSHAFPIQYQRFINL